MSDCVITTPSDHSATTGQGWARRVARYVDELTQLVESIDLILDGMRFSTGGMASIESQNAMQPLRAAMVALDAKANLRDVLLGAADAPPDGATLCEKLCSTRKIDDARLARRCRHITESVGRTHQRAVMLFTIQYGITRIRTDLAAAAHGASAGSVHRGEALGVNSRDPVQRNEVQRNEAA